MRIKTIVDEDFTNYKKAVMFIGTISCGGKCCKEAHIPLTVCQNDEWRSYKIMNVDDSVICERYLSNPITKGIVFGGLEPFEQTEELIKFVDTFRNKYNCMDDIVIYTGYYPREIPDEVETLRHYPNITIKFGRYIPNRPSINDNVLGISLASNNQYAIKIS